MTSPALEEWSAILARGRLPGQIAPAAADEGAAFHHETPGDLRVLGDADAGAGGDGADFVTVGGEPQRAPLAHIDAVETAVDGHCLRKPARPAHEILDPIGAAVA